MESILHDLLEETRSRLTAYPSSKATPQKALAVGRTSVTVTVLCAAIESHSFVAGCGSWDVGFPTRMKHTRIIYS